MNQDNNEYKMIGYSSISILSQNTNQDNKIRCMAFLCLYRADESKSKSYDCESCLKKVCSGNVTPKWGVLKYPDKIL